MLGRMNQENLINAIKDFEKMETISKIEMIVAFDCVPDSNNVDA